MTATDYPYEVCARCGYFWARPSMRVCRYCDGIPEWVCKPSCCCPTCGRTVDEQPLGRCSDPFHNRNKASDNDTPALTGAGPESAEFGRTRQAAT